MTQGTGGAGTAGETQQLQGRVSEIDRGAGTMTLAADDRTLELRGTPTQLERFNQYQMVTVQFQTLGNNNWLLSEGIGGAGMEGDTARTVTGTVSELDPEQGTVVISNRTFNAHPLQLQSLQQGQQVRASFQTFEENAWLQNIETGMGGSGQMDQEQMGDQQDDMQQGQGGAGAQQQPQNGMQQGQAQRLQGQVVNLNPNAGTMTVSANGRTMTVRGTPTQLQRFDRDQRVTLQYRTYGNTAWLLSEGIGGAGTGEAGQQTISGTVARVNPEQGTVMISNRTFNAHPDQLQQLQEGQRISATYRAFGNNSWLQSVQGGQGQMQQGQGGSGQQQQQQDGMQQDCMQQGQGGAGTQQQNGMQQGQGGAGMQQQNGMQQGQGGAGMQQQNGMQQGQAQRLQWQVVNVNPNAGTMTVSANGRTMTVRGTPTQLQRFNRNQQVTLQYRAYGSTAWLLSEGMGGAGTGAGRQQTITGSVSRINPEQGTVVISNRTFNAHPDQIQQLQEGQRISASYQAFGNNNWLQNVQGGQGQMQQGQGGSGMQQEGMQQDQQQGQGGSGMQQQEGMQQGQAGGGMQQQQQNGMQQGQAQRVQGQVVNINPNAGMLTVSVNGRSMTFRGTPTQLERFSRNQQVTLQYRTFGQNAWLLSEGIGGAGAGAGRAQTVTGTVSRLDPAQGTVVISNRTFYGHPTQLQQLQQGQRVSASYQTFGNNAWLQNVQAGQNGMQQGGMQQGGMQQGGGSQ